MIEIFPLRFSKEGMANVPKDELLVHLLLAQVSNEILILRKQTMLCSNALGSEEVINAAALAGAHLNLRLLAGKLYEGYNLLRSKEAGEVHRAYIAGLHAEGISSHRKIMKYFGGKNLVATMRQKAAFHWDYPSAEAALEKMAADLGLTDFICMERGNSLYASGAMLHACQMAELVGVDNVAAALDTIFDEVAEIASCFEDYANAFMVEFMDRHVGLSPELFQEIRIELNGMPDIQKATMPYFLDTESVHRDIAAGMLSP